MKSILSAATVALAFSPALQVMPTAAQVPGTLQNPQVEIAYVQPANPNYKPIYERLKKLQVLEELQQFLVPLKLPRKLTVQVDQCGATSRPYVPGGPATVCYELVEQIEAAAAKADPSLRDVVIVGTF